jgi:hypothetical protein
MSTDLTEVESSKKLTATQRFMQNVEKSRIAAQETRNNLVEYLQSKQEPAKSNEATQKIDAPKSQKVSSESIKTPFSASETSRRIEALPTKNNFKAQKEELEKLSKKDLQELRSFSNDRAERMQKEGNIFAAKSQNNLTKEVDIQISKKETIEKKDERLKSNEAIRTQAANLTSKMDSNQSPHASNSKTSDSVQTQFDAAKFNERVMNLPPKQQSAELDKLPKKDLQELKSFSDQRKQSMQMNNPSQRDAISDQAEFSKTVSESIKKAEISEKATQVPSQKTQKEADQKLSNEKEASSEIKNATQFDAAKFNERVMNLSAKEQTAELDRLPKKDLQELKSFSDQRTQNMRANNPSQKDAISEQSDFSKTIKSSIEKSEVREKAINSVREKYFKDSSEDRDRNIKPPEKSRELSANVSEKVNTIRQEEKVEKNLQESQTVRM